MKFIITELDENGKLEAREISEDTFLNIQAAFFNDDEKSINNLLQHGTKEIRVYFTADEVRRKYITNDDFISPKNKLFGDFDKFISEFDLLGPAKELVVVIDIKTQTIEYNVNNEYSFEG